MGVIISHAMITVITPRWLDRWSCSLGNEFMKQMQKKFLFHGTRWNISLKGSMPQRSIEKRIPCNFQSNERHNDTCVLPSSLVVFITAPSLSHDDVIKWKHKGQWRGALIFSLICAWINGWVNIGAVGDLRSHRAYYDVTVMMKLLSNVVQSSYCVCLQKQMRASMAEAGISYLDSFE